MKKMILLLSFLLMCQNQLIAQRNTAPAPTYNITVTRSDAFPEYVPGHAHTTATLEIKIGSTQRFNSFTPDSSPAGIYNFPVFASLPGFPPPIRYVKVSLSNSPTLFSGYYALTTTVGDYTLIPSEPSMIDYADQFGYGVAIYCTGPNQYTMKVTRFECNLCVPPGGVTTSKKVSLPETSIVPNPSLGLSELSYTAKAKETISINVIDMYGKVIRTYIKDVEAGLNKLPIDIQNYLGGTYIVKWRSSTGENGTLKMVKK